MRPLADLKFRNSEKSQELHRGVYGEMNPYLKQLEKIEFLLTYACTGRCKHCSEGEHKSVGECLETSLAKDAVRRIAEEYDVSTVMVFGGEPLLFADAVCGILGTAKELGISRRQVITNGYFSRDIEKIRGVARGLFECGVNDLLLSVDAFHQETIPLDIVKVFAREAVGCGIPIRLQPAWLVGRENDNPYNTRTREILLEFSDLEILVGDGNVVFPEGNALKYLAEYFEGELPQNPYIENPLDVRCVSFSPSGDVLNSNIYKKDIMEILRDYKPE